MLEELLSQAFWIGLAKIIGVNIILSGDNAVVIALAARSLPPKQQKLAIFWGAGAAIILRIILTLFAVALLSLPWLKRSEEHTSELQSHSDLVCRLLLEKKKKNIV